MNRSQPKALSINRDSVFTIPSKCAKLRQLISVLGNLPDYTIWNTMVVTSVVINFYVTMTCFCFLPRSVLNFTLQYSIFDFIYIFNFLLVLVNKNSSRGKVISNWSLFMDVISILSQIVIPISYLKFENHASNIFLYCRLVTLLRLYNLFVFKGNKQNNSAWRFIQCVYLVLVVLLIVNSVCYLLIGEYSKAVYEERYQSVEWANLGSWYWMLMHENLETVVALVYNLDISSFYPTTYYEILLILIVVDHYLEDE